MRQLGHVGELGPGPLECWAELLEEMRHPGLAAGEPVGLEQPHLRPAQAEALGDRLVDLPGRGDAVMDQPERFAPDGLEQPVGDVRVDLDGPG